MGVGPESFWVFRLRAQDKPSRIIFGHS
jgi:hypothetical protein